MAQVHLILTVTLNPAIDKIVKVPVLNLGADHRASDIALNAGGKGINVARALKCLGFKSIATGFAGGVNGQSLLRALLLEGFEHHFVFIQGETRVNVTIQDQYTGQSTRILEAGPMIDQKDLASFRHKFSRLARNSEWIVLKEALNQLLSLGAARAIISLGAKGAVASDGQYYWRASGPQVKTMNVLGSGDAMTAGLLFALVQKSSFGDAFAFAVAAGTASVLTCVPGQLDPAQLAETLQKVTLKNL